MSRYTNWYIALIKEVGPPPWRWPKVVGPETLPDNSEESKGWSPIGIGWRSTCWRIVFARREFER